MQIENIELSHPFAITLGLILNEAITNAIKIRFSRIPTKEKFAFLLNHTSDSQILYLTVPGYDGPGLPQNFNKTFRSFHGHVNCYKAYFDDIGGNFSIENNQRNLHQNYFSV